MIVDKRRITRHYLYGTYMQLRAKIRAGCVPNAKAKGWRRFGKNVEDGASGLKKPRTVEDNTPEATWTMAAR